MQVREHKNVGKISKSNKIVTAGRRARFLVFENGSGCAGLVFALTRVNAPERRSRRRIITAEIAIVL